MLSVTTSDARCFDDDAAPWAFFEGAPGSSELLDDAVSELGAPPLAGDDSKRSPSSDVGKPRNTTEHRDPVLASLVI